MSTTRSSQVGLGLVLFILSTVVGRAATLAFENLSDGDVLTAQYPGLTFSNAVVLTAGISLNEFEFPPSSGVNVISDSIGPIEITFDSLAQSVSGYFTYAVPLRLTAFDSSNTLLGQVSSMFATNMALSGDPSSSPNEFLQITSQAGIRTLTISGDPNGASFVLDDLSLSVADAAAAPEPVPSALVLIGSALFALLRKVIL